MIGLGCIDLDLALRIERPAALDTQSFSKDKMDLKKWNSSNRISLMVMKRAISGTFRDTISEEANAKGFLKELRSISPKKKRLK